MLQIENRDTNVTIPLEQLGLFTLFTHVHDGGWSISYTHKVMNVYDRFLTVEKTTAKINTLLVIMQFH